MKLYPKLFLSHLAVSFVSLVVVFVVAEWASPRFYQEHIVWMMTMLKDHTAMGADSSSVHLQLENGFRSTITSAILTAFPVALLASLVVTHFLMRRLGLSIFNLTRGSKAISLGQYTERLPERGTDELAELAHHFNRMAEALNNVERSRVEMITNVAHELRTPLTALKGYSEALQDGVMSSEQVMQHILREVAGLEQLVQDLSWVSRVEAGQVVLRCEMLRVDDILTNVQHRFSTALAAKNISFQVVFAPQLWVYADFNRTVQVLNNLLSNALKYTPSQHSVTLRVSNDKNTFHTVFTVTNTGITIPPEHLPRIFERFYKVAQHRTPSEGGIGVGLTIAKSLVNTMQGHLEVRSQQAETTFLVYLPTKG